MATAALWYHVDEARIWRLIELYNKYMARYLIGGQGGEPDQMIYRAARSGNTASTFVVAALSTAEPLIYLFSIQVATLDVAQEVLLVLT